MQTHIDSGAKTYVGVETSSHTLLSVWSLPDQLQKDSTPTISSFLKSLN